MGSSDESSEESEEEEEDDGGGETTMSVYAGPSSSELTEAIKGAALDLIGSDELPADTPLMDAGLDSLAAVEFQGMLAKQFPGLQLPATLIFDFPSVSGIATHMDSELRAAFVPVEVKSGGGAKKPKAKKPKAKKKKKKKKESSSEEEDDEEDDDDDGGGETTMSVYSGPPLSELTDAIKSNALDLIGSDELPADTPLMDAGLDSLAAVEFQGMLAKQFPGLQLPATLIFDFPSVSGIATHMDSELRAAFVPVEVKSGGGAKKPKAKKPKAKK